MQYKFVIKALNFHLFSFKNFKIVLHLPYKDNV